ncbi:DUF3551 domain-containing protein [Bradyrhizobium sp. STM 3843]|uniref:DUF3551 domain-containing protein n=1 Tax=unclassified Bradyrhizobium TaxID=2631580 RepID=UPI0009FC7FC1|nr:DUF3551 domain-containing protein [Bradyrhizobium sp. STM 3843]
MRGHILFASLFAIGLVAIATSSSPGQARDRVTRATSGIQDRYCLQGRRWGYPGNCQFATRSQCLAAASGTNARCGRNPRHTFAGPRQG